MDSDGKYPPGYLQQYGGDQCIKVAIAFIVLGFAAASARFYAKTLTKASLAMDDFLIIPALVSLS